jgi:hypothetical protein
MLVVMRSLTRKFASEAVDYAVPGVRLSARGKDCNSPTAQGRAWFREATPTSVGPVGRECPRCVAPFIGELVDEKNDRWWRCRSIGDHWHESGKQQDRDDHYFFQNGAASLAAENRLGRR